MSQGEYGYNFSGKTQSQVCSQPLSFSSKQVDDTWTAVAKAVVSGTLGFSAKVFKGDEPKAPCFVICVYTKDFTNEEEVWAVEESLRKLGITVSLCYKPDIYTTLGIYSGNSWGIRPTIYRSRART